MIYYKINVEKTRDRKWIDNLLHLIGFRDPETNDHLSGVHHEIKNGFLVLGIDWGVSFYTRDVEVHMPHLRGVVDDILKSVDAERIV